MCFVSSFRRSAKVKERRQFHQASISTSTIWANWVFASISAYGKNATWTNTPVNDKELLMYGWFSWFIVSYDSFLLRTSFIFLSSIFFKWLLHGPYTNAILLFSKACLIKRSRLHRLPHYKNTSHRWDLKIKYLIPLKWFIFGIEQVFWNRFYL